MGKLTAIFVMCLFLVSLVPTMAFADEATTEAEVSSTTSTETDVETGEKVRGISEFGKENRDAVKKLKETTGTRKQLAKEFRAEMKARFNEAKERFLHSKEDFKSSRDELRECKKGSLEKRRSAECRAAKEDFKSKAKPFLKDSTDTMVALLEKANEDLEKTELENKEELVAENNVAISDLQEVQTSIEILPDEGVSEDDLKDVAGKVRNSWQKAKKSLKVSTAFLMGVKFNGVIQRADHLETKMDKVLARLEKSGADVSVAEEHVASFNTHVDLARKSHADAMLKFQTGEENSLKEGQELLKEARTHLKEAHAALKEAVKAIKATNNGSEALEAESDDVEAEDVAEESTPTENQASETTETTEGSDTSETTTEVTTETGAEVSVGNTEASASINTETNVGV